MTKAAVLVSSQGAVWSAQFWNRCKNGLRGGTSRACRGRAKRKRSSGRIGRGEQFCTDAVGQQAYLEQRLGAYPPAPLPVKPILRVSGPSRGWLSVWGSFSCCETRRYAGVGSSLRMASWLGHCRSAPSYDSTSSGPLSWSRLRLSVQRFRVDMVSAGRVIFQPSREQ
jgi:hypothetical protein